MSTIGWKNSFTIGEYVHSEHVNMDEIAKLKYRLLWRSRPLKTICCYLGHLSRSHIEFSVHPHDGQCVRFARWKSLKSVTSPHVYLLNPRSTRKFKKKSFTTKLPKPTRFNCVFMILCSSLRIMLNFIIVSELKMDRPNARPG